MAKTEVNLISQVNLFFLSVFLILVYCITICIDARLGTKQPFSTTRTPGLVILWNLFYFFCQLFPLFVYYLFILKYSWFLLGPGTHKVLFVLSKSLFPQSCVNSVIKSHWSSKSNFLGVLSVFVRFPSLRELLVGPRTFATVWEHLWYKFSSLRVIYLVALWWG